MGHYFDVNAAFLSGNVAVFDILHWIALENLSISKKNAFETEYSRIWCLFQSSGYRSVPISEGCDNQIRPRVKKAGKR